MPTYAETWAAYPNDALEVDASAPISFCRQEGCHASIWWGQTRANRKRCPFDVNGAGERLGTSHWRTCLNRPKGRRR